MPSSKKSSGCDLDVVIINGGGSADFTFSFHFFHGEITLKGQIPRSAADFSPAHFFTILPQDRLHIRYCDTLLVQSLSDTATTSGQGQNSRNIQ